MKISFLEADVPLTKQFTAVSKTSYPNVLQFTSHTHDVNTLDELYTHLVHHASQGHCLLKGELTRPLVDESRAGSTNSLTPTQWVCKDLDGLPADTNIGALMDKFEGFEGVDYILQYSASHGVMGQPETLKAHVFILLDSPANPALYKQWSIQQNLQISELNANLGLTKSQMSLSYLLDPTVAQNDKLIYIAKPVCTPSSLDSMPQRIYLVRRTRRYATFTPKNMWPTETLKAAVENKINELRHNAGLPKKRKFDYKTHKSGVQYLAKPDTAIVSDIKYERGFVYLNLNGGDSWAYYHPEDKPDFLYNFKSEPVYKISELAPSYYTQAKKHAESLEQAKKTVSSPVQATASGKIYLAFRDMKSAAYYNGIYDTATQKWLLAQARSEKQLSDFMIQHGQPDPDVIPIWDLVFDPSAPPLDIPNRRVNTYSESEIMKQARGMSRCVQAIPKTVNKILFHVVGSDIPTYDHFINWLAFITQKKVRTQTAWLFQGIQGTGKGTMIHSILRPLLGHDNTAYLEQNQLEDRFNTRLENSLLTCIDELSVQDLEGKNKILSMLKTLVTEPILSIRPMRAAAYSAPNYNNIIGCNNVREHVSIESSDRRYNVGEYQTRPIILTEKEVLVDIPAELPYFANYLLNYAVDEARARKVHENKARADMKDLSMTSVDKVTHHLVHGELEELFSYIVELNHAQGKTMTTAPAYKDLMLNIVALDYKALTREELQIIYGHCVGSDVPTSPTKFSRFLGHHGIKITPVYRSSNVGRGLKIDWVYDQTWYDTLKEKIMADRAPKKLKAVA